MKRRRGGELEMYSFAQVQNCADLFLTISSVHTEQGKIWHNWGEHRCSLQKKEN